MKPVPTSHNEYRGFLRKMLRKYFPDLSKIGKDTWRIYNEFKSLDLSMVDVILRDKYSVFGPPPRQPSCMFRSLLLMNHIYYRLGSNHAHYAHVCHPQRIRPGCYPRCRYLL